MSADTFVGSRTSGLEAIELQARCAEFLFAEAEYLDDRRFRDWLALLTEDVTYRIPIRVTRGLPNYEADFTNTGFHMKDTYPILAMRVERLYTEHAYAEDPPSRTTWLVSNVRSKRRGDTSDVDVKSKFACYRAMGEGVEFDLLMGERRDVLRLVDGELKLASRTVMLAHTTLPTANLGLFL